MTVTEVVGVSQIARKVTLDFTRPNFGLDEKTFNTLGIKSYFVGAGWSYVKILHPSTYIKLYFDIDESSTDGSLNISFNLTYSSYTSTGVTIHYYNAEAGDGLLNTYITERVTTSDTTLANDTFTTSDTVHTIILGPSRITFPTHTSNYIDLSNFVDVRMINISMYDYPWSPVKIQKMELWYL